MTSSEPATVTDPLSRHNLHLTDRSDLIDIGPWTADQLYAAVERADDEWEPPELDYEARPSGSPSGAVGGLGRAVRRALESGRAFIDVRTLYVM